MLMTLVLLVNKPRTSNSTNYMHVGETPNAMFCVPCVPSRPALLQHRAGRPTPLRHHLQGEGRRWVGQPSVWCVNGAV